MTNKEILERLPVGEVVPKQILAAMKRKGLIYDYSYWGYIESVRLHYKSEYSDNDFRLDEIFPLGNAREAADFHGASRDDVNEHFGRQSEINYLGFTFGTKYYDGCFQPYLVKTGPYNGKVVRHKMCLWGALV